MYGGYTGKILWVNLSDGQIRAEKWDEELGRKYIGGTGLAARIIWDKTSAATDPFGEGNLLVFMTGPVTGTRVPTSGRWFVTGLSPLTNIWGQASAGGTFGYSLKLAGLDGVIVAGIANKPVYLWIDGDKVEIRDAGHLWGKNVWEVDDNVKKELGARVSIATIGQAGERLVRFAGILCDGKMARAAARCGLGAVMGSKKLKAVAVRGNRRPAVHDEESLKRAIAADFVRKHLDYDVLKPAWMAGSKANWDEGKHGIKNYREGHFQGFRDRFAEHMASGEILCCTGCSVSCIESKSEGDKRQMVGEHASCLGARCMINDFEALEESYDLCNQYGMDSMSVGGVVSFAMELYEKGIITKEDTDGIDLSWGNSDGMLALVRKIGEREGFGNLLGEGVRRAAERIGGLAPEYAMHIKGHELPMYDVRAWNAGALEYATASSGAHHFEGTTLSLSRFGAFWGEPEFDELARDRFAIQNVGRLTAKAQDYGQLFDSMVVCKILIGYTRTRQRIQPEHLLAWLNYVTGGQFTMQDFWTAGERIFNLKRMISVRRGISRKDDTLPARLLVSKRGGGDGAANNLPPLGMMLSEYYSHRGWSEEGVPTKAKLRELGLEELLEQGR